MLRNPQCSRSWAWAGTDRGSESVWGFGYRTIVPVFTVAAARGTKALWRSTGSHDEPERQDGHRSERSQTVRNCTKGGKPLTAIA